MTDEHQNSAPDAWKKRRVAPALEEGAVHVWLVRAAAPKPSRGGLSTEGETGRSVRFSNERTPSERQRIRQPRDNAHGPAGLSHDEAERARGLAEPARSRFVLTRSALRARLADYLGCAAGDVGFDYGEMGKPHLRSDERLHFSVAHTGDLALLAFAWEAPVGIDIERLRSVRRQQRIARRVLAPASAEALARVSAAERDEAFIWAWTQREAYVKAIGSGLLRSPDPLPFVWPPRPYESAGWQVMPLPVATDYSACLVIHGSSRRVHLLRDG